MIPTSPSPAPRSPWQRAIRQGYRAAAAAVRPAIALWLFGLLLILGYFQIPWIQEQLAWLQQLKELYGFRYSAISTALVAGVIPLALEATLGAARRRITWAYALSNVAFWAYKGMEVDALYRCQAWWFGDNAAPATIALKVLFDQLVYAPLLGLTNVVLFYRWRDREYRPDPQWKRPIHWFRQHVLPVLIANWFVWIPACTLVYLLPLGLQLPIQNLILCFWVLIVSFFTEQGGTTDDS